MKTYDLRIEELHEFEGGHIGWFSKGHHEPADFLTEASFEAGKTLDIDVRFVRQEWWRCVPAAGEHFTYTVTAQPNTRGAFPVTVVED
jgi:hypothetical protein